MIRNRSSAKVIAAGTWFLFAVVMYLIATELIRHWVSLPALGNVGFTLVFVLFSLLHCTVCFGWRRTWTFFCLAAVISYVLEEIGVGTGWIYGAYHYSGMLGPKLGHVPLLIPLAWFMMIYPSWVVGRALLNDLNIRTVAGVAGLAFVSALVMTGWDTVMDPGMAAAGTWVWEKGGAYFGVPLQNYFGWLLTTFLVYAATGLLWRHPRERQLVPVSFAALPIIVYTFYGVSYMMPRQIAALQLVALFAMVTPGCIALLRTWNVAAATRYPSLH